MLQTTGRAFAATVNVVKKLDGHHQYGGGFFTLARLAAVLILAGCIRSGGSSIF